METIKSQSKWNVWYFLILIFLIVTFRDIWIASSQIKVVSYNEFQQLLKDGKIFEVVVSEGSFGPRDADFIS